MWALGGLFYAAIYVLLALVVLILLAAAVFAKRRKLMYLILAMVFGCFIFIYYTTNKANYKAAQLAHVGTYELTNYPDCDSCILALKEDNTYTVTDKTKKIESGDWHYDFGADYFIVYLNNERDQLGVGRFRYVYSKNTYNKTIKY